MDKIELDDLKAQAIKERKRKGITVMMEEKLRTEIKIAAAFKNMTMREYMIQAVIEKLTRDKQYE